MPKIRVNGAEYYYEDTGGQGKETIMFAHGFLFSCRMFDAQVAALKDRYRCIAYDFRGQGQSEVTADGYDMETLYEDATELIEALNAAPCHFVGLSMGGFIGMRLAARRPQLIKSLILMETSADPEPNQMRYRMMSFATRLVGLRPLAAPTTKILMGQKFLNDPARRQEREIWTERLVSGNPVGVRRALSGVIDRKPIYDEISNITTPTLILVGDQDVATVPAKSERIHGQIAGSKLVIIPGAGHSSAIEEPQFVNDQIATFLDAQH
jgi:pimeloyl-ACP methyl ester carboxylesterase